MFEILIFTAVFCAGIIFERIRKQKKSASTVPPQKKEAQKSKDAVPATSITRKSSPSNRVVIPEPRVSVQKTASFEDESVPDCVRESRTRSQYLKEKYKDIYKKKSIATAGQLDSLAVTMVEGSSTELEKDGISIKTAAPESVETVAKPVNIESDSIPGCVRESRARSQYLKEKYKNLSQVEKVTSTNQTKQTASSYNSEYGAESEKPSTKKASQKESKQAASVVSKASVYKSELLKNIGNDFPVSMLTVGMVAVYHDTLGAGKLQSVRTRENASPLYEVLYASKTCTHNTDIFHADGLITRIMLAPSIEDKLFMVLGNDISGNKLKYLFDPKNRYLPENQKKKTSVSISASFSSRDNRKEISLSKTRTKQVHTRTGSSYYNGSDHTPAGLVSSSFKSTLQTRSNKHRQTHCYACKTSLSSNSHAKCSKCNGLICECGACFCRVSDSNKSDLNTTPVVSKGADYKTDPQRSDTENETLAEEYFDPGPIYFGPEFDHCDQEYYDHLSDASPDFGYAEDLEWDER